MNRHPIKIWFHSLGSPGPMYRFAGQCLPWLAAASLILLSWGLVEGLFIAPPDYQQGDAYRIIFIHVPSAWLSMSGYIAMAVAALVALVWQIKTAEIAIGAMARVGAVFTAVTLATGAIWGKPMWGAYWAWDARLTTELILLFIYLGIIALSEAFDDRRRGARAAAILVLIGVVNIPIIHYSVLWWNTLHQGGTVKLFGESSIHPDMLRPLLVMTIGSKFFFGLAVMLDLRARLLSEQPRSRWARAVAS